MEITVSQFVMFLALLARTTALLAASPLFGMQIVPMQMKIVISLFLALVLMPLNIANAAALDVAPMAIAIVVIKEIAVGLIIGYAATLVFAGARFAGDLMGYDIGMSLSNVLDPATGQSTPILGEFFYQSAILVFLLINGHHALIEALQLSYKAVGIGGLTLHPALAQAVIAFTGTIFILAIKIASPVMLAMFLTNVVLAILSRLMPQANIFVVSLPLKFLVGLAVLMSGAPLIFSLFRKTLGLFESNLFELVRAF